MCIFFLIRLDFVLSETPVFALSVLKVNRVKKKKKEKKENTIPGHSRYEYFKEYFL